MIRDRIREFRRVPAGQLQAHPRNWRTHPPAQRDALVGLLEDIGLADAVIARELPNGSLQLIDGHLRAEVTDEALLPVLVVDLDDEETEKLLLAHDAITALADVDQQHLADLLSSVQTDNTALAALFDDLAQEKIMEEIVAPTCAPPEIDVPQLWQVMVQCADEQQQRDVYERLTGDGCKCRLMTL